MFPVYKQKAVSGPFLSLVWTVMIAAAYLLCCLPSFYRIGHFVQQIFLAVFFSLFCTALFYLFIPRSLRYLGKGLSLFLLFYIGIALCQQIRAQNAVEHFDGWINTFFYDKPLTVAVVWACAFISMLALRVFLPFTQTHGVFRDDFPVFYKNSVGVFMLFYVLVLLYCFILQRKPGMEPGLNLVPFSMILSYFNSFSFAYESILYLIGNILCFFPFGFFYRLRRPKPEIVKTVLLPVVLSLLIEVSQLLFRMGDFDVDDIIMNSFGFYIGWLMGYLVDKVRALVTKGEETSIFSGQT